MSRLTPERVQLAHDRYRASIPYPVGDYGPKIEESINAGRDELSSFRLMRWARVFYGVELLHTRTIGYHMTTKGYQSESYSPMLAGHLEAHYKIEGYDKIRAYALETDQDYEEYQTFEFLRETFGLEWDKTGYKLKEPGSDA